MHIVFLNPQGNFDPHDSYWSQHPDFGGQLVYVKEVAVALAQAGHEVDIVTRRIEDADWPEFASPVDHYEGVRGLRIVRVPCGPPHFLRKEDLWPYLGTEWVPGIRAFYKHEGRKPDVLTTHYADGGLCGAILRQQWGLPFTFTGHSLGAQKMDKLHASAENLAALDAEYHFSQRIMAERVAMNHADRVIVSTQQERVEQYGHRLYAGAIDPTDERRFTVVPPGVNLRIFAETAVNAQEEATQAHVKRMFKRDLFPERQHLPAIVSSSRLDAKKNHLALVQAFAGNKRLQEHANLVIVVRGMEDPLRDHGAASASERAILDEIVAVINAHELWGKLSAFSLNSQLELAAAYRALSRQRSVFCLTALYEPFGLAPLEAIAAGLPGVVTRNGGPSESLVDATTGQEFGVLVDPANPADIARGLLRVVADASAWQAFHDAGIQRVLAMYTWQRTAAAYAGVLQEILAGFVPVHPYFTEPALLALTPADLATLYGEGA
ncbi:MAG: glycosyltransferase family 1 protein [Chloroflexi bacterium]|nr:glycosyltransferase family 1 protein [Chloroflexota bacterium]